MSSAPRYTPHYTISDYVQWPGDWELWDGYAIAMSPAPSVRHQRIARQVFLALNQSIASNEACCCEVLYEVDWRVKDDTVFRPDLVVVCEPIETEWIEKAPALIVEVLSPGTERNDREIKRARYAHYGVDYYLIVNPKTESIETLHLVDGEYQPADPARLSLGRDCQVSLDTASIWA